MPTPCNFGSALPYIKYRKTDRRDEMELILYIALGFVLIMAALIAARLLLPIAFLYFMLAYGIIPILSFFFVGVYFVITGSDAPSAWFSWAEVIQIF